MRRRTRSHRLPEAAATSSSPTDTLPDTLPDTHTGSDANPRSDAEADTRTGSQATADRHSFQRHLARIRRSGFRILRTGIPGPR